MPTRETLDPAVDKPLSGNWLPDAGKRFQKAAAEAHHKARRLGRPVLASATVAVPAIDPISVFRCGQDVADRLLWLRPDDAVGLAGLGAAWTHATEGPVRFTKADAAWRSVIEDSVGAGGQPIAFYGFAFADDPPSWKGYPAGLLTVPHVTLHRTRDGTRVILAALVHPGGSSIEACRDTLACAELLSASLARGEGTAPPANLGPLRIVGEFPPEGTWKDAVRETARAVKDGALRKAVLAREIRVQGGGRLDPVTALRNLQADYPDCTVFAVGRGDRCFLGATPERLVRLRDGEVDVAALAGSAPRGRSADEDRALGEALLRSAKDRVEHAVVVEALRDALADVTTIMSDGGDPRLLTVRNTHHLYTPIRAVLRERRSVLDLIGRLHPTPAVGGVPRDESLRWIRRHEGWDRGWYAGPAGWIDASGDGEASVAIRSGLLDEHEATLFAGCGIVAESDPDQELAESRWKSLRPLLSALSRAPGDAAADPDLLSGY